MMRPMNRIDPFTYGTASAYTQNPDGSWTEATALKGTRWYRVEAWLHVHGFRRLAAAMGRWDERKLGR